VEITIVGLEGTTPKEWH